MLDESKYIWLLFKFILSVRLSNSLWELDAPLIVSIQFYDFIKFIILLYMFLVISLSKNTKNIFSFSKFSDVLPAFTCANAVSNLWRICLGANILICSTKSWGSPLPFCCLINSRIFSTILTIFFEFSFEGTSLLLMKFLKLMNDLLIFFTILPCLFWLSSYKSFIKNNG